MLPPNLPLMEIADSFSYEEDGIAGIDSMDLFMPSDFSAMEISGSVATLVAPFLSVAVAPFLSVDEYENRSYESLPKMIKKSGRVPASGVRGVKFVIDVWVAFVRNDNGTFKNIGEFTSKEEAARAVERSETRTLGHRFDCSSCARSWFVKRKRAPFAQDRSLEGWKCPRCDCASFVNEALLTTTRSRSVQLG